VGAAARAFGPGQRKKAEEIVASVIDPRGRDKASLKRVLPDITREKPFAMSSESLLQKFRDKASAVNDAFDDAINNYTGTINSRDITDKIKAVRDSLKLKGQHITREDRAKVLELLDIEDEIRQLGRRVSLADARTLKQKYDAVVAGTEQNFLRTLPETSRSAAAKEGFYALREGMIDKVPELKDLGQLYNRYATPRDILAKTETRNISGTGGGIGRIVELGATANTLATGNLGGVKTAVILRQLDNLTKSTPFKLANANLRTSFANAMESGNISLAVQIAGHILGRPFGE
jgi:hypothetical protein